MVLSWLFASKRPARTRQCQARPTTVLRFRPRLEILEDRLAPATLTVINNSDTGVSGDGSLRGEIKAAASGDTINFAAALNGAAISLSGANGTLNISKNLTIDASALGNGVTLQGNNSFGILSIASGLTVILNHLTITGGTASSGNGGGILVQSSTLTVQNCTISGNTAVAGGGIAASGTSNVTVQNSTVSGNTSTGRGPNDGGGGIEVSGTGSTLTVQYSTVSGNTSTVGKGGGIYFLSSSGGTLTVQYSTISGNSSASYGAGLHINAKTGTATVQNCTISTNFNPYPGNSTYYLYGGGIDIKYGNVSVRNCTISANSGQLGAGIATGSGSVTIQDSTISGNTTSGLIQVGGGIIAGGALTLKNTLVSGNTALTGPDIDGAVNFAGSYNNLIGNGSGMTGLSNGDAHGDLVGANARLDPSGLQNNGGQSSGAPGNLVPLKTVALLPGSAALGTGFTYSAASTDERGVARPVGSPSDIGAFQTQGFTLTITGGNNQSTPPSTAFPVPLAVSLVPVHSGDPVNGGVITFTAPGSGASASITGSPATISSGSAQVTATANAATGSYVVTASAGGGNTASFNLSNTTLSLGPLSSSQWTLGQPNFPGVIPVNGSATPFTLTAQSGLPPGLTASLSGSNVVFTGTPTTTGAFNNVQITVKDANNNTSSGTFSITINLTPSIGLSALTPATWTAGHPFSGTIPISAGTGPFTVTASSGLPGGLSASTSGSNVTLTGTPTGAGTFTNIQLTVQDTAGATGSGTFTLTINPALGLGSLSQAGWTVNQPGYSGTIAVSGGTGAYSNLVVSGLPTGLSAALSGSTITISGTPTAGGTFSNVAVSVQDSTGATASGTYTLTIHTPPSLGSLSAAVWDANASGFPGVIPISGGTGPYTVSAQSGLPPGLTATVTGNNVTFTGTPTTAGTYSNVQLTIQDAASVTANGTFSITINPALSLSALSVTQGVLNQSFSSTISVSGGSGTYSNLVVSGLPTGLSAALSGSTITISGTPTVSGSFALTVSLQDSTGGTGSSGPSLAINGPPVIFTPNEADFAVGTADSFTVSTSGFPAPTISESGTLPAGLTFDAVTGVLSGTPAVGTQGDYSVTITASNGIAPDAVQSFKMVINQPPTITSAPAATFTVGTAGSFMVTATGFPEPTFTESGALPLGLTFSSTGVLSGTPAPGSAGTYSLAITASNGTGPDGLQNLVVTVMAGAVAANAGALVGFVRVPVATNLFTGLPTSDPNAAVVQSEARAILGHDVDAPTLQNFTAQIGTGSLTAEQLVAGLWNSPEHRQAQVMALYQKILRHGPDQGSLLSLSNQLAKGKLTEAQLEEDLLNSPEYHTLHPDNAAYIRALYHDVLGRVPTDLELNGWLNDLANGVSVMAMVHTFVTGPEHTQQLVEACYHSLLGRDPDPTGEANILQATQNGAGLGDLVQGFLSSPEYVRRAANAKSA